MEPTQALVKHSGDGSAVAIHESALSTSQVVAQVQLIQHVMQEVMHDGEHYGVIPGCGSKPALLKAGAEKLCFTFRLAPSYHVERHDLPGGHREYEVRCDLTHIDTGRLIAAGVGLCSTMESKYRWRKASRVCPECGGEFIIKGKREYGGGWLCFKKRGGCGAKFKDGDPAIESQEEGRVENEDIADVYNTVLKMAKKRAHVDATITATAASDIFTQDIEDLPVAGEPYAAADVVVEQQAPEDRPSPPKRRGQDSRGSTSAGAKASTPANQTDAFEDPAEQPDYKARAKKARLWLCGLPADDFPAALKRAQEEVAAWPEPVRKMGRTAIEQANRKRAELEQKIQNLSDNLSTLPEANADAIRAEVAAETEAWPAWWRERAAAVAEAVIAGVGETSYAEGTAPEPALKKAK